MISETKYLISDPSKSLPNVGEALKSISIKDPHFNYFLIPWSTLF